MGYFDNFLMDDLLNESDEFDTDTSIDEIETYSDEELAEEMAELDEYVADLDENDGPEDIEEAYINLIVTNEQNFYNIMNVVAANEMNYFMEHGEEMVYEEGKIKEFMGNITKLLNTAWKKIVEIFNSITKKLIEITDVNKKYAHKYKDVLGACASHTSKGIPVRVSNNEIYNRVSTGITELRDKILNGEKVETKDMDLFRARLIKTKDVQSIEAGDFAKALKKYYNIKADEKDIKYTGKSLYNFLTSGVDRLRAVKDDAKAVKKTFATMKKEAKKVEKSNDEKGCMSILSVIKAGIRCCSTIQSVKFSAEMINLRNISRAAHEVVKNSKKAKKDGKESTSESAMFGDYSYIQ